MDAIVIIVKAVFIFSIFWSEAGKYLTRLPPSPNRQKLERRLIADIIVVPSPTSVVENNLAFIIQKKNPSTAETAVLSIKKMEFLYRESFKN